MSDKINVDTRKLHTDLVIIQDCLDQSTIDRRNIQNDYQDLIKEWKGPAADSFNTKFENSDSKVKSMYEDLQKKVDSLLDVCNTFETCEKNVIALKVPINKLETFHDTLINGATDLGNQYDTIISTCGKIQEYWESEGWADIYSDLVSKMDTMQAFMEDMYSYGDTLGEVIGNYITAEVVNGDMTSSLPDNIIR